jgi:putative ABC transport system substrate-binding protein
MRRREFIGLLGASFLAPIAVKAQQAGRTYRLGVLLPLTQHAPINVAFLDEFRRGGFIEGQNLGVEWRAFAEHFDRMSLYAAELVKARVDVITTATDEAIRALQQATKTIPIIAITDDMLGSGFVNSVARPDGNITGVNILGREGNGKRQDILIEAVPGLRRMAVLADVTTDPRLTYCRRGRAPATSNFQSIASPEVTRSQQPLTRRRHRAPRRSTLRLQGCSTPIGNSLGTVPQRCTYQRSFHGPKRRRKAPLPPTDRPLMSSL